MLKRIIKKIMCSKFMVVFSTIILVSIIFGSINYLSNLFIFSFIKVDAVYQRLKSVTIWENIFLVFLFLCFHSLIFFTLFFTILNSSKVVINCIVSFLIMLLILIGFSKLQYVGNNNDLFFNKFQILLIISGLLMPLFYWYVDEKIKKMIEF
jgi:hypothetical protein